MQTLLQVRHISVSIARSPQEVYLFASNVENLPRWATGLGSSIKNVQGEWIADGGPLGPVQVQMAEPNGFGVLDHDVSLKSGKKFHNPVRVLPNGTGSEVTFTLLRQPETSDQEFARDAKTVEKDLGILKSLLER